MPSAGAGLGDSRRQGAGKLSFEEGVKGQCEDQSCWPCPSTRTPPWGDVVKAWGKSTSEIFPCQVSWTQHSVQRQARASSASATHTPVELLLGSTVQHTWLGCCHQGCWLLILALKFKSFRDKLSLPLCRLSLA